MANYSERDYSAQTHRVREVSTGRERAAGNRNVAG
jgi:hypothetical protein